MKPEKITASFSATLNYMFNEKFYCQKTFSLCNINDCNHLKWKAFRKSSKNQIEETIEFL